MTCQTRPQVSTACDPPSTPPRIAHPGPSTQGPASLNPSTCSLRSPATRAFLLQPGKPRFRALETIVANAPETLLLATAEVSEKAPLKFSQSSPQKKQRALAPKISRRLRKLRSGGLGAARVVPVALVALGLAHTKSTIWDCKELSGGVFDLFG